MLFQLKNIVFGFSPKKKIFNNLSLDIKQGKVYVLMGANGSGKTTLLNLINGFHRLHSGSIVFKQQNIDQFLPFEINRIGIGRTFQDLRLASKLTVRDNILLAMQGNPTDRVINAMLPAFIFKKEYEYLEDKTKKILEDFLLEDIKDSVAQEISFGQQKILNLACCVANEAELLLLDEPVASISPQYRERIVLLIRQLQQAGKTILMIEHNLDFVDTVGDRFLFLDNGRLSKYKTFDQLQNSKEAVNTYF